MKQARVLKYAFVALLAGLVVVGHAMVLRRFSSHMTRGIVLGLILLVLFKHVGLLGPIHALFERRSQNQR